MSYYDHATLMSLKLERWSDERFLPHHMHRQEGREPGRAYPPERRETWLARFTRWLSRRRHVRT